MLTAEKEVDPMPQPIRHQPPAPTQRTGGEVYPDFCCACFAPRKSLVPPTRECWFCRYADFQLKEEKALEIGFCCWPKILAD